MKVASLSRWGTQTDALLTPDRLPGLGGTFRLSPVPIFYLQGGRAVSQQAGGMGHKDTVRMLGRRAPAWSAGKQGGSSGRGLPQVLPLRARMDGFSPWELVPGCLVQGRSSTCWDCSWAHLSLHFPICRGQDHAM